MGKPVCVDFGLADLDHAFIVSYGIRLCKPGNDVDRTLIGRLWILSPAPSSAMVWNGSGIRMSLSSMGESLRAECAEDGFASGVATPVAAG